MADTLSPNPATQKQRLPLAARLQSPTSPFFLCSKDHHRERAQARAAHAAAIRRKSVALNQLPQQGDPDLGLGKAQILELFCSRIASNSPVKIYQSEDVNADNGKDAANTKNETQKKIDCSLTHYSDFLNSHILNTDINPYMQISPLSTLESSFEALNVKKFDVAFVVDPLYHQTSAQFDEGGAKRLLMNNLGVYGGCRVLLDSSEVPGKCIAPDNRLDKSDTIDLSIAGGELCFWYSIDM